ncbi:hypothetical protein VNO78_00427 [Psophocarpus tetragonolobus]|uniref:J domain-containing protein required for chloroplast accumulation response 1 n=1 Tax=Psophocarpus tetragonolobus TaxID=3891 RepID=A0AAN9T7S3_PSOTE
MMERESVLLIRRSASSNSNLEVDFTDVFGGPPRRQSGEEGEGGWCRWPPERAKPVFGDDTPNRRRHPNNDTHFFDDIFGGEESASASPTPKKRVGVGDPFSLLSSPPHPLVASLPSTFSLPAKLTNGADLPTFGSPIRGMNPLYTINHGEAIVASNGSDLSDSYLSMSSTQRKDLKNDLKPYRHSLLSHEFSNSSTSDKADKGNTKKHDMSTSEVSPTASNGHFHFSIYKWASKGVPMVMSLRTERASRNKDKVKLGRCSSTKECLVTEITTQNPIPYNGSPSMNNRKQDVSTNYTATENGADSNHIVEQIVSAKALSDTSSSLQTVTKDVPAISILREARSVESSEKGFSAKTEAAGETKKLETIPLHFLFKESDKRKVNAEMITREREENRVKSTKKLSAVFDVTINPMKQEEKKVSLRDIGHSRCTSQGSVSLGENTGKGVVKEKVKEFARIFNQEAVTKSKFDTKSRPQGSIYKQRDALRTKNVESGPEQSKKDNSSIETTNICGDNLSHLDDISESAAIPDISFTVIGDKDESFCGSFMIQVLSQDEGEVLQNQENQEIQMIDNKIQQWSKGKEGNIRSLLSTLQYVLWPECGWKAVPLVDIIEGSAVKRSYQRALLCLHPDKLQQKGASSDQKYIAEKVFDILQEAWTQFNMLGL